MLSRLQELKKEEETLLKIKLMLQEQLNRLKFEEGALKPKMTGQRQENPSETTAPQVSVQVDDENEINHTRLQLSTAMYCDMEEEEDEELEAEEEGDY
ncbi:snRNA-activating protein complex subunit 5 [Arapaima gigas]